MPGLTVVMYHYVRDLPNTKFPKLKGMLREDFRQQVADLSQTYEMATLESSLAYLAGAYQPSRTMCLLTFDDGLKEHYTEVLPVLAENHVQGVFFLITRCMEDRAVAPVHMNHFLMADLEWDVYKNAFLEQIAAEDSSALATSGNEAQVARTYPWDTPEVAQFKYLFNFVLDAATRDRIVQKLFEQYFGSEKKFADELYLSWDDARTMQTAGMVMGGHTHQHMPLSRLVDPELDADLRVCRTLLDKNLHAQPAWPFSYPYGKNDSFNRSTVEKLMSLGFDCSFATESGMNYPHGDRFAICRIDCKVALQRQNERAA
jgi:peptidoglycan/xylan/chitin deacetylase (PgdA/CDA1 family)